MSGCAACGGPGPLYEGEAKIAYCEVCSHVQHGEKVGERFAHAEMFMVAAKAARHNGISAPDLHALVAEALLDEEGFEGADVPAIVSLGELRRADRGWLRPLEPGNETGKAD